ncbi:MAG: response regulator transcription factor [Desulfobacterales bacterium]|nr:response regulator transcription factor [Desulfobacterales bacterium]
MSPHIRLLIVEDNIAIVENITDFFEPKGFILDFAQDGIGGLHLALTQTYDVIVLDLMLPGMDGLTLCKKLRQEAGRHTPVLMLTAKDTLEDKLLGFDSGADDYLVKPFALSELEARVKALSMRRHPRESILKVGELRLNPDSLEVTRRGKPVTLNNTCITLLKELMEAHPMVVKKSDLEFALWGDSPPGSDALRSHLYTLRQKIDKPFDTPMIETVHGIGIRLKD